MTPQQLLVSFCTKWKAKYEVSYFPNWAVDTNYVKFLVKGGLGWEELEEIFTAYLAIDDDDFINKAGHSLRLIGHCMPKIAAMRKKLKAVKAQDDKSKEHPDLAEVLNIRKKLVANGDEDDSIE